MHVIRKGPDTVKMRLPLAICVSLQIDQKRRNNLLHVLRLPDVHQQLVVHRLPDHTLKTTDAGHTDSKHQ